MSGEYAVVRVRRIRDEAALLNEMANTYQSDKLGDLSRRLDDVATELRIWHEVTRRRLFKNL